MKKPGFSLLPILTLLFAAFTLGVFIGRNQNHETVHLSVLATETRHKVSAEAAVSFSEEAVVTLPVDINAAGIEELSSLPGIGETLARRILDYRDQNGAFAAPEELLNVEGIGSGKLEAILDYVTTGG